MDSFFDGHFGEGNWHSEEHIGLCKEYHFIDYHLEGYDNVCANTLIELIGLVGNSFRVMLGHEDNLKIRLYLK